MRVKWIIAAFGVLVTVTSATSTEATAAKATMAPYPAAATSSVASIHRSGGTDLRGVSYDPYPDSVSFGPPPDAYPYGGRTDDGQPLQPRTLYSSAHARLTGVKLLGGYLTASAIEAITQSGADPDAAATSTWWSIVDLVLHPKPGGPDLIAWTGSTGPSPENHIGLTDSGNKFPDYLQQDGARPRYRPTLKITIHPPDGPRVTETLSCADWHQVCDTGSQTGISLLDKALYERTSLEDAFASIDPALDALRASRGSLKGLELIAGKGFRRTEGDSFAQSAISGLSAAFVDGGKPIHVTVGVVATFADSGALRAGLKATDFEVTPSECSDAFDPPACPGVVSASTQLPSPTAPPPGISGVARGGVRGGGGEPGAGTATTPGASVATVGKLLPQSGGSQSDVGGGTGGGGDAGSSGQQSVGAANGADAGTINPAALPPSVNAASDGGSLAPWLVAVAGVALLALGVVRWRRQRSYP